MAPWTASDDQKSQVTSLVEKLLKKPESAPRGPSGFAAKAIQKLGFDEGDKGRIGAFISKQRLIPHEHQYAVAEVPAVTVTAPKTACPKTFYSGPNPIVHLKDYLDQEGNVIQQVELLEGQKVTTVPEWKAYLASLGQDKRGKKKYAAVRDCLGCYFSHFANNNYNDAVLQDLEALGCTAFPWADADGNEHEDFLGVRNHSDLDKRYTGGQISNQERHETTTLKLMKNERNSRPGKAPSTLRKATYKAVRRRGALLVSHSKGYPAPYDYEIWDHRFDVPEFPGRVTQRGVWKCDACGRDCMDGASEFRGVVVGNVIDEHDHATGKGRWNVLCHFCNEKGRPTTDRVKDHLTKAQMPGLGAV